MLEVCCGPPRLGALGHLENRKGSGKSRDTPLACFLGARKGGTLEGLSGSLGPVSTSGCHDTNR